MEVRQALGRFLSNARNRFFVMFLLGLALLAWAATHRPSREAASLWGLWTGPSGHLYLSPNGLYHLRFGPDEFGGRYAIAAPGQLTLEIVKGKSPFQQRWSYQINQKQLLVTGPDGQSKELKQEATPKKLPAGAPLVGVWWCARGSSHKDILELCDDTRYFAVIWPKNREHSKYGRHAAYLLGTWNQDKGKLFLSPRGSAGFESLPYVGGDAGSGSLQLNSAKDRRSFQRVVNLAEQTF